MSDLITIETNSNVPEPIVFGYLERLELAQVVDPDRWSGQTLTLWLRPSGEAEAKCKILEFHHVQGIRLGPLNGLSYYGVEIRSITNSQLENMYFQIVENDHNAFSFYCKNFITVSED